MKKIYASMFALFCAMGIAASAQHTAMPIEKQLAPQQLTLNQKSLMSTDGVSVDAIYRAPSRADEWVTLGKGYFYDAIFSDNEFEVTVEQNASDPGLYRIPDAWTHIAGDEALPLYFDATNPDYVTFGMQQNGLVDSTEGPVYLFSFTWYLLQAGLTPEDVLANPQYAESVITMANNVVEIPAKAMLEMFPDSEENPDNIYYANSTDMYIILPGAPLPCQWGETLPTQMVEGCFEAIFGASSPNVIDVNVQKNNWYDNYYRVYPVWENLGMGADFGNPIQFDTTYPECVICPLQSTGVYAQPSGLMYVANEFGMFYDDGETTIDQYLAEADAPWEMDENGKIYIPAPYGVFFFFPYTPDPEEQGKAFYAGKAALDSWIQMPEPFLGGVQDINIDTNDQAPVYYNIQGMQVVNPQKGQIYIVKKGDNVSKTVIK